MSTNMQRTCGSCSACCYTHSVKEIRKDSFNRYTHQINEFGCAVYGIHPKSCRVFRCLWLTGEIGTESHRPDILGLVIEREHIRFKDGDPEIIQVAEVWEGASESEASQLFVQALMAQGVVIRVYKKRNPRHPEYHLHDLPETAEFYIRIKNGGYTVHCHDIQLPRHPLKG